MVVVFEASWGASLRFLSLGLWAATLLAVALFAASVAEWIPTGDDNWSLVGGQLFLLLLASLTDGRRRRHIKRILRPRDGQGIVIETFGLFGPIQRFVPQAVLERVEMGAPDMKGVMTLRLPGQLNPYRVDVGGRELDLGLAPPESSGRRRR